MPRYPVRTLIPIAFVLLLLQGIGWLVALLTQGTATSSTRSDPHHDAADPDR